MFTEHDDGDGDTGVGDGGKNLAKDPAPLLSRLPRLLGVGVLYLQPYLPSSSTLSLSWSKSRSSVSSELSSSPPAASRRDGCTDRSRDGGEL